MAQTKVTAELINSRLEGFREIDLNDERLIDSFQLNSSFDPNKHLVELHIYTLGNTLLRSVTSLSSFSILGGKDTEEGSSSVYLNPEEDSKSYGYPNGGIKLAYLIINNLFSDTKFNSKLYIEEISNDRTELRLNSVGILPEDLKKFSLALKEKLNNSSNFKEFRLNFGNNLHFLGINIDYDEDIQAVNIKLYEPLPQEYVVKDTLEIIEYIAEPIIFEIDSEFIPDEPFVPKLREANFNVDLDDNVSVPSQYFNFDELFSYKVNNSNYEVMSMFNEKSAEISIDYGNYSDFIHFSSAEERLINFKYKLDLINSYETSISNINSDIVGSSGTTNNASYYENLIKGVVDNFDHYERFLYFESGSYAWPKLNNSVSKPYTNQVSSTPEAVSYFTNQRASASNFDLSNFNALVNTIPSFIREDENNAPYNLFVNMLGQHFDNLYIYSKAVSDKYNADNRLRVGVSRDLVEEAIKSLGVKLYNSSNSLENLFKYFVGEITSGSGEVINNEIRAKQRISGGAGSTGPGLFSATVSGSTSDPLKYYLSFNNLGGNYNTIAVYEDVGSLFSTLTNSNGMDNIDYLEYHPGSDVYLTISRGGTSIGPFRYIAYSSENAGTDGNLFISPTGSIFTHTYDVEQVEVLFFNVIDADGNDNTNAINALPGISSSTVFLQDDTQFSFTISDSITSSEPLVEKDIPLLSQDLYQKSVYKRIYHNLTFFAKNERYSKRN